MPPRRLRVAIVGAGAVGLALARMLAEAGDHAVVVGDCTEEALERARARGIDASLVDAGSAEQLSGFVRDADAVVAAVPDRLVPAVASAAAARGAHALDFSRLDDGPPVAPDGGRVVLSACGVSPGLVDAVVRHLAGLSDDAVDIDIAVGAIPARRANRLGYALIWNLDGLFAEYTAPCQGIEDHRLVEMPALSGLTELTIGGTRYEAFRTAGVTGSMQAYAGTRIRRLVCRTIRYPGHLEHMLLLLDDLGLRNRRDLLLTVLRNGLPRSGRDMVLIDATATPAGAGVARRLTLRIDATEAGDSALAVGSAAHAAHLLDEIARRPGQPVANTLEGFLASRFAAGLVTLDPAQASTR